MGKQLQEIQQMNKDVCKEYIEGLNLQVKSNMKKEPGIHGYPADFVPFVPRECPVQAHSLHNLYTSGGDLNTLLISYGV